MVRLSARTAIALLLAILGLGGCATSREGGDEALWIPQRVYLNRVPHASLYVELAAVAGTEPSDAVLGELRDFLTRYCDKPGGIQIVRDKPISRAEAQGLSHDTLACRYLKGPQDHETTGPQGQGTNSKPAFMYILYYDSALAASPWMGQRGPIHKHLSLQNDFGWVTTFNPHARLLPYPSVIHIDRRYLRSCPGSLEGLLLQHEAGHLLGLAQNESHGLNFHCTNRLCLMRSKLMIDLPRALFTSQKTLQTNLCTSCQKDLSEWRTGAPATDVFFVGPVLIRAEDGYFVASLPSELKLLSGDPAKFDFAGFLKQAADNSASDAPWTQHHDWTHYSADLHDSPQQWAGQISGIENAKADKLESVRQACTNAVPALQRVLGEAYLNGNEVKKDEAEAVKWFRKAAEGGDTDGQRDLGHALAEGQGTKADLVEATRWLSAAAQKGDKAAKQELEALRGRASVKQVKREQQAAELGQ
jgi:hypothetical protein